MNHPSLATMPVIDILRLIRSENVGCVTFFSLIRRFGSASAALEALPHLAARGGKKFLNIYTPQQAESELEKAHLFGAKITVYGDKNYPALLHEINDAPPLLMMRGSSQFWQNKRMVAMVGSRNASAAGCSLTRKLARDCGEHGLTVVSGLARGIDAAAHAGALPTGTVGVIAGGIDNIYPPENKMLYQQMAEGGAILSEQPFGATPHARSFPGRNRIIAGMCEALLVVEATLKSGSLISSSYALEQGREVMAIPGSPLDPRSQGPNGLIKQGAALIETVDDILRAMQQPAMRQSQMQEAPTPQFMAETIDEQQIDEARKTLLQALSYTPVQIDSLARQTQIPIALLQAVILEMELAGHITRAVGGHIALMAPQTSESSLIG
jgi:DNA processing protein